MGVYHLMGLGLSPGAITGPLSYLGHRYQRWNVDDQAFFARSGEVKQRQSGEKVGDVQALILFTTREVLTSRDEATGQEMLSHEYVENAPGRTATGPKRPSTPMKTALRELLGKIWPAISGGRTDGSIFWCEVDRRDIKSSFERIAQVIVALSDTGQQGKEKWVNLTGGTNIINLALELAANLSGEVARVYYVQAANQEAEKCVYHTAENGYWVELPVMPLALSRVSQAILEVVAQFEPLLLSEIYSRLKSHPDYGVLVYNVEREEDLLTSYVSPMWTQGLLVNDGEKTGPYKIGPQWGVVQPYQTVLEKARMQKLTIEQLAAQESWIEYEALTLKGQ